MSIRKYISAFYTIGLLSPAGLATLANKLYTHGTNLMALLAFATWKHGAKIALVDDNENLSYQQLLADSIKLALALQEDYQIQKGQRVGLLCRNHSSLVKAIFAVSQLGADIYLLNTEISLDQLNKLLKEYDLDLIIYDGELLPLIEKSHYKKAMILSYHDTLPAINNLLNKTAGIKGRVLQRSSSSRLVLLTSGTTGSFKLAVHRPSIVNFISPFLALLTRLKLLQYHTGYIATPIYHGYGLAVLFLFLTLGNKVILSQGFDAKKACGLIREHQVEVITVVPLMLKKMLSHNVLELQSLACIASGGAELNPKLIEETSAKLGDVLYNLYGTSEAGLNIIATPQDLKYKVTTIGQKINGAQVKILDSNKKEVEAAKIGQLCIKNRWSMGNSTTNWIETGDFGYRDTKGYYYLCGRMDDMIVSAGENVYPIDIEQVLISHPQIEDVAVIGTSDEDFGQRLKALVLLQKNAQLSKEELFLWLRSRVARYQLPKEIIFLKEMPYTPLGKLDKKQLKNL